MTGVGGGMMIALGCAPVLTSYNIGTPLRAQNLLECDHLHDPQVPASRRRDIVMVNEFIIKRIEASI